jgi:hypothetical protein
MQTTPFTPRKHHIPLVSASEDENAELGDFSNDEEEDEDYLHSQSATPSGRRIRLQWT